MKKVTFFATALFLGATTHAQLTFDFEAVTLAADSYDNGENGVTSFTDNQISLSNNYDAAGGYWSSGFAISNMGDTTTAGFTNMYSAFTGSGRSSDQYGVYYGEGNIQCANNQLQIDGFYVTNSTYAAISMRDGDSFGKQFGSANGADGMADGTNGEDFFKIWVIAEDATGSMTDSVEFYLADYRFSDNTQDYIVDDWNYIDLSLFSFSANKVSMRFESSDMGNWGINTPTYVIVDDIKYSYLAGLSENQLTDVKVYPNPVNDVLNILGEQGTLTLRDMNGRIMEEVEHNNATKLDCSYLTFGVYFIELRNDKGVYTQKIIK